MLVSVLRVLAMLAVVAAAVDLAELRLPNAMTYTMLAGGLIVLSVAAITEGPLDVWRGLAGAAAYGGWMLAVALIVPEGYGLGDVKFAAALGLWTGLLSWMALATAVLIGQLFIVVSLIAVRVRHRYQPGSGTHAALGPALAAGAMLAILAG